MIFSDNFEIKFIKYVIELKLLYVKIKKDYVNNNLEGLYNA